MTVELMKFLLVLLVVMLGFAMSFKTLFHSETYGETWLHLFKAMLGEVGFFDDFSGDRYDFIATVLLVMYLVVIQIMLLNLLIAILSVSHAKVQENAELEFKVSKAILIKHYRWVVDDDVLPAPFNMDQLILSCMYALVGYLFGKAIHFGKAKRALGQVVFWLVMGPVCVAGGTILWVLSVFYSPFVWRNHYQRIVGHDCSLQISAKFLLVRYAIMCAWCIVGAPLCLLYLLLREPVVWIRRICRKKGRESSPSSPDVVDVNRLLLAAPCALSTDALRKYLDDPMSDPDARQDEKKRGTTVEHMKQLRDHLGKKADERFDLLETKTSDRFEVLEKSAKETKALVDAVDGKLDQLVYKIVRRDEIGL